MRLAIVSNVQANIEALQAVLEAVDAYPHKIDAIVSAGDSVGLGSSPNEVLNVFRDRDVQAVRGNYDDAVAFDRIGSGVDFLDAESERADQKSVAWTRQTLSEENCAYLRSLPRDLRLTHAASGVQVKRDQEDERTREYRRTFFLRALFGGMIRTTVTSGKRILVMHGSPRALNEFVREDTANSILATIAREAQADVLITGHAGTSFQRDFDEVTFVGAGSVSGSTAVPGRAEFAIVNVTDDVESEFLSPSYQPRGATTGEAQVVPFPHGRSEGTP